MHPASVGSPQALLRRKICCIAQNQWLSWIDCGHQRPWGGV